VCVGKGGVTWWDSNLGYNYRIVIGLGLDTNRVCFNRIVTQLYYIWSAKLQLEMFDDTFLHTRQHHFVIICTTYNLKLWFLIICSVLYNN